MNYTYVNWETLTQEEVYSLAALRKLGSALRSDNSDSLNEFIGTYIPDFNSDTADLSKNKITAYLLQVFENAQAEDESLQTLDLDFDEKFSAVMNQSLADISETANTQTQSFDGFNFGDDCGCDDYCDYALNPSAECWTDCMCGNEWEAESTWTLGGSTIGQIFTTIGDTIINIGNKIGWDNIIGTFINTDDDGSSNDAPAPTPQNQEEEKSTDWGKIALYGGLVVVIGLGGFYAYKKIKG